MDTYHKIQTVFLRDPETNHKTLLEGQYAKPEFEWLANNQWQATEKIDGTNIRIMWDGVNVSFNGKTDNAQLHGDLIQFLHNHFTVEKMATQFGSEPTEVCCYGEGYGAGIQSGGYYQQDRRFILFDVLVGSTWLERPNIEDVSNGLDCPIVPIVWTGTLPEMIEYCKVGYNSVVAEDEHLAEGIVMRPMTELFNRRGERVITKLKYKDFPR